MELLRDPETWIAVAFVLFLVLAAKPIFRAIVKGLDARAERIRNDLAEAERLRREAEALLADYMAKQRAATEEAAGILARAREEAEVLKKEAAANLAALLQRRERMALDGWIRFLGSGGPRHVKDRFGEIACGEVSWILAPLLPKLFRAGIVLPEREVPRFP